MLATLSVTTEIFSIFTTHLGGRAVLPRCARHGDHLWRRRRVFLFASSGGCSGGDSGSYSALASTSERIFTDRRREYGFVRIVGES